MPHCLLILGTLPGLFSRYLCGMLYKQYHTTVALYVFDTVRVLPSLCSNGSTWSLFSLLGCGGRDIPSYFSDESRSATSTAWAGPCCSSLPQLVRAMRLSWGEV